MLTLQADSALRRVLAEVLVQPWGDTGSIGICLGGRPQAHVHRDDVFGVEHHVDLLVHAGNSEAVPLAWLLDHRLRWGQMAEDRTAVPCFRCLCPFLGVVIGDLDLDRIGNPVLHIGVVDNHAAVRTGSGLKFQVQDEIVVIPGGPDRLVFACSEDTAFTNPDALREYGI